MKHLLIFLLPLVMVSCANITPADQFAIDCFAYARTVKAITPFKPRMSVAQVRTVDQVMSIADPACRSALAGNDVPQGTINSVRDALRDLVIVQQQVKS